MSVGRERQTRPTHLVAPIDQAALGICIIRVPVRKSPTAFAFARVRVRVRVRGWLLWEPESALRSGGDLKSGADETQSARALNQSAGAIWVVDGCVRASIRPARVVDTASHYIGRPIGRTWIELWPEVKTCPLQSEVNETRRASDSRDWRTFGGGQSSG